jgi:uncharacterized protein with HEPN domain
VKSCDFIAKYIAPGEESFMEDVQIQDAVIRRLEIIGEAAKSLTEHTKRRAPSEPWKQIAGMRDKLIHAYFGVDLEVVWQSVSEELPSFRETVLSLSQTHEGD